jgi:hypothetical protein
MLMKLDYTATELADIASKTPPWQFSIISTLTIYGGYVKATNGHSLSASEGANGMAVPGTGGLEGPTACSIIRKIKNQIHHPCHPCAIDCGKGLIDDAGIGCSFEPDALPDALLAANRTAQGFKQGMRRRDQSAVSNRCRYAATGLVAVRIRP